MAAVPLELIDTSKVRAHMRAKGMHPKAGRLSRSNKEVARKHAGLHALGLPDHHHGGVLLSVEVAPGRFQNGRGDHEGQPEGDFTGEEVNGTIRAYSAKRVLDARKPAPPRGRPKASNQAGVNASTRKRPRKE